MNDIPCSCSIDDAHPTDDAVLAIVQSPLGEMDRVRIEVGPLQGLEGLLVRQEVDDRLLLKLYDGVFLETTLISHDPASC